MKSGRADNGNFGTEIVCYRYFIEAELSALLDFSALGEKLLFEPSRGGDLFPHLYADLPLSAVLWEKPLPLGVDGAHQFPEMSL